MQGLIRVTLAYLTVLLIWSGTPLAIQWSALDTGVWFAVTARMMLATLGGLALCVLAQSPLPRSRSAIKVYVVMGMGFYLAMCGVYWAATKVHSGLMSVLFGLTPIASSMMSWLWFKQKMPNSLALLGMLGAVLGLSIIFSDQTLLAEPGFISAVLIALCAMLTNAWTMVWLKQYPETPQPLAITVGSIIVSLPLFTITCLLVGGFDSVQLSLRAVGSIVYLAIPGSLLAFVLYYYILKHLTAEHVALILVLTPVLALLWGRLFNHESLPTQTWLGALIILLGLVGYVKSLKVKA